MVFAINLIKKFVWLMSDSIVSESATNFMHYKIVIEINFNLNSTLILTCIHRSGKCFYTYIKNCHIVSKLIKQISIESLQNFYSYQNFHFYLCELAARINTASYFESPF